MNGSPGNTALAGDFKERLAAIVNKHLKNLGVKIVNV